jgi:hypothetical protein
MAKRRERMAGQGGRFSWLILLLLLPAVLSLLLHVEKNRRGQEVRQAKERFAAIVSARPIDQAKAQRTRFYEIQYFLGYSASVSYAVADLILRLDRIASPLRLLAVQVDPGLQDLKFRLTVGVAAADPEAARRKFTVFIEELRNFPGVTQASFSVPGRAGENGGLHVFHVSGQAEWQ